MFDIEMYEINNRSSPEIVNEIFQLRDLSL